MVIQDPFSRPAKKGASCRNLLKINRLYTFARSAFFFTPIHAAKFPILDQPTGGTYISLFPHFLPRRSLRFYWTWALQRVQLQLWACPVVERPQVAFCSFSFHFTTHTRSLPIWYHPSISHPGSIRSFSRSGKWPDWLFYWSPHYLKNNIIYCTFVDDRLLGQHHSGPRASMTPAHNGDDDVDGWMNGVGGGSGLSLLQRI